MFTLLGLLSRSHQQQAGTPVSFCPAGGTEKNSSGCGQTWSYDQAQVEEEYLRPEKAPKPLSYQWLLVSSGIPLILSPGSQNGQPWSRIGRGQQKDCTFWAWGCEPGAPVWRRIAKLSEKGSHDQLVMSATGWSISDVCHWLRIEEESTHQLIRIAIHSTRPSSNTIFTNISQDLEWKHHMTSRIMGLPRHSLYICRQLIYDTTLYNCFFFLFPFLSFPSLPFLPFTPSLFLPSPSLPSAPLPFFSFLFSFLFSSLLFFPFPFHLFC